MRVVWFVKPETITTHIFNSLDDIPYPFGCDIVIGHKSFHKVLTGISGQHLSIRRGSCRHRQRSSFRPSYYDGTYCPFRWRRSGLLNENPELQIRGC